MGSPLNDVIKAVWEMRDRKYGADAEMLNTKELLRCAVMEVGEVFDAWFRLDLKMQRTESRNMDLFHEVNDVAMLLITLLGRETRIREISPYSPRKNIPFAQAFDMIAYHVASALITQGLHSFHLTPTALQHIIKAIGVLQIVPGWSFELFIADMKQVT